MCTRSGQVEEYHAAESSSGDCRLAQDKNPAPLNQLDFLMEETFNGLMETGNALDNAQGTLKKAANKLGGSVHLLLLLIR